MTSLYTPRLVWATPTEKRRRVNLSGNDCKMTPKYLNYATL